MGYLVLILIILVLLFKMKQAQSTSTKPEKYKTYFYKVQAKHVDFVLLDEKLVARCIVELDDSSHDAADRKERDDFVDEVLRSVGYQVIRTRAVTEKVQQQIRDAMKK